MTPIFLPAALAALAMGMTSTHAWTSPSLTPPLGWNSNNFWGCGVNATVLMDAADAMVSTGLAAAGYQYVNSDDCWALAERDARGNIVANPEKFPDGFAAVASYIHARGLRSGLYTAKGPFTCAGFAGSCGHELQDAAVWAQWGIDYVKDDSCSQCGKYTDDQDYGHMFAALQASGRPMVLTVEGNPDDTLLTGGGYGNAKRVGHDIRPYYASVMSEVDIASGLWLFAHNATNATSGGWWNDLDMMEIGNVPDFVCGSDGSALARCRLHYTMWCIMKSPLILGNNLPGLDAATIALLANKEAVAVNQDSWGVQARRVHVSTPANTSLGDQYDNIAVLAVCDPSRPTQAWRWRNESTGARNGLYIAPCDATDPFQEWTFTSGHLLNAGVSLCADASAGSDPGGLAHCSIIPSQLWNYSSGLVQSLTGPCLALYDNTGPDVTYSRCRAAGDGASDQLWSYSNFTGLLQSLGPSAPANSCLVASAGPGSGPLYTVDEAGNTWCLVQRFGSEGGVGGAPCDPALPLYTPYLNGSAAGGVGNYTLRGGGDTLHWNNMAGASGPWAHTRYVAGYSGKGGEFTWNITAAQESAGAPLLAADQSGILNDDMVGGVSVGGAFCLDLSIGGMLEVWAGPLSAHRWAVALVNRSPSTDTLIVRWDMFNVSTSASFSVRDIWAAASKGSFTGAYKAEVAAHDVAFLVLTPA